ncbi:MAG: hypothetical protein LBJ67_09400, partial [Planctomycetaceae bacterium]|nr:hypothetical protein [Planctomycetaceae bacterium]
FRRNSRNRTVISFFCEKHILLYVSNPHVLPKKAGERMVEISFRKLFSISYKGFHLNYNKIGKIRDKTGKL